MVLEEDKRTITEGTGLMDGGIEGRRRYERGDCMDETSDGKGVYVLSSNCSCWEMNLFDSDSDRAIERALLEYERG